MSAYNNKKVMDLFMKKSTKKLLWAVSLIILCAGIFGICSHLLAPDRTQKEKDVEYTVVPERDLPPLLLEKIQEHLEDGCKITYEEDGYLYIARGYGVQNSGGYSICVDELYTTQNALYLKTTLLGPHENEITPQTASTPYIVVKCEGIELPVVFQ